MKAASILLVDDDALARRMYGDWLRAAGHDVTVAESAGEARGHLAPDRFEVLVADLMLPGEDGLSLLAEAKQRDAHLEVVVITALDLVAPAVRAMKSGAGDYLVKPLAAETLVNAVSRCLEKARLFRENQALREQMKLFEAAGRVTQAPDRDRAVGLALSSVRDLVHADSSAFYLRDPAGRLSQGGSHATSAALAETFLDEARTVLGDLRPLEPIVLAGLERAPRPVATAAAVCVGEEVQGALVAFSDVPLASDQSSSLVILARHLALALRGLGRQKVADNLAYLDDLTQLFNARYLDLVLEREIAAGRPFSILFLDLDQFKAINDAHGHLVGSRLLVEMGRVLQACLRDDDVVARYGGDEYVIVLSGSEAAGAQKVAERVRLTVATHPFLSREKLSLRLTTSIGVASFPEHAKDKTGLLDAADRAMYQGKRGNRNVTSLFVPGQPPSLRGES